MLIEASVREQLEQVREARAKIRAEDGALHAIEESLLHWLDIHAGARTQPLPIVEPKVRASNGAAKANLFKKLGTVSLPDAIMRALQIGR